MTAHRHRRKAIALWGGGALLIASTGIATAITMTGTATATAASSGTASSAAGSTGNGNGRGGGNDGQGGGNSAGTGSPGKALGVSGTAGGTLAPGVDDVVTVRITNPNSSAVRVTRVTGAITSVTARTTAGPVACDRAWYRLDDYAGGAVIAGASTGTVPMRLRFANLPDVDQDRCKGASFTFTLTATADQELR